jgi:hypothetical protein
MTQLAQFCLAAVLAHLSRESAWPFNKGKSLAIFQNKAIRSPKPPAPVSRNAVRDFGYPDNTTCLQRREVLARNAGCGFAFGGFGSPGFCALQSLMRPI